jgi:eukaryotic-like serine/threonine-protein kinase
MQRRSKDEAGFLRTTIAPALACCVAPARNASCFDWWIVELLAPGTIVADRYQLIRKRGAGGVGSVWLAHDLSLDSFCGLKLIDSRQANAAELGVRAEREARSAAQLRGTHVIDVFEHGIWNGIPFIAMEYLEGEDLRERLTRTARLSPEQTYRIVAQIARALARAHSIGIIHRDLKPDNIFLVPGDEDEVAKLLDFGIARHEAYSAEIKTTQTGSLVGTPCYVSPEQALGATIDWRTDLWALGVIVFECLTGKLPFASEALGELMLMILSEPIPALTQHNAALPKAIDDWWYRASRRDPAARFQSAKELADALATALTIQPRLEVPDIRPLGLRALSVSSPAVPLSTATPDEHVPVAENASGGWRSANSLADDDADIPARRPPLLTQRSPFLAGAVVLSAVVLISVFARTDDGVAERPPALLRHSLVGALPVPKISEVDRAVSAPKPVPKRAAPKVKARPAAQTAPWPKPAPPVLKEPPRACEREPAPAESHELREPGDVPDYGI